MAVKTILGLEAKLYRNTGTYASPTWDEVKNVKDLSLGLEKSEADVSNRESGWEMIRGALKKATIEFQMIYDTADTDWTAFKNAFLNGTAVELAVMDGPIATAGSEGLRASFEVLKWSHSQNLEEALMTDISIKPTRADNPPAWYVAV
jgi:hypothetical protein